MTRSHPSEKRSPKQFLPDNVLKLLHNRVEFIGVNAVPILRFTSDIQEDTYEIKCLGRGTENSPITYLIDFEMAKKLVDEGDPMNKETLDTTTLPIEDINGLGNIIKATVHDEAVLTEVWMEGLGELVNAMRNIDLIKIPALSQVHQELTRLLIFTTIRWEIKNSTPRLP
ncbi:hypothetical protein Pmani_017579 [Petrolisthes manimaculis]|uniref:Uncharacterized protein n=1 Tax=Petrolisthes manimaculis TaxID=1843537 RepID=A0AAE1PMC4_9EUCA|nr:hypothetical protein Pmani_017579 [Petrolisthes manimaculis]